MAHAAGSWPATSWPTALQDFRVNGGPEDRRAAGPVRSNVLPDADLHERNWLMPMPIWSCTPLRQKVRPRPVRSSPLRDTVAVHQLWSSSRTCPRNTGWPHGLGSRFAGDIGRTAALRSGSGQSPRWRRVWRPVPPILGPQPRGSRRPVHRVLAMPPVEWILPMPTLRETRLSETDVGIEAAEACDPPTMLLPPLPQPRRQARRRTSDRSSGLEQDARSPFNSSRSQRHRGGDRQVIDLTERLVDARQQIKPRFAGVGRTAHRVSPIPGQRRPSRARWPSASHRSSGTARNALRL